MHGRDRSFGTFQKADSKMTNEPNDLAKSLAKTIEEQTQVINNLLGITAALMEELLSTRGEEIVNAPKRDLTGRVIKGQ